MTIGIEQAAGGVVGFLTLCSAVVYGLKKNGLLTIGRPVERRNNHPGVCPQHSELVEKMETMDKKLDHVSEGIAEIRGYLKGRNGF